MSLSIDEQLLKSRLKFQFEVKSALSCRTKAQKRAVYARWLETYSEQQVRELVAVARDKEAAKKILAWTLYEI